MFGTGTPMKNVVRQLISGSAKFTTTTNARISAKETAIVMWQTQTDEKHDTFTSLIDVSLFHNAFYFFLTSSDASVKYP